MKRAVPVVALLVAGTSSIAPAQRAGGLEENDHVVPSRIIHPEKRKDSAADAYFALRAVAACEAGMHQKEARALLASPPGAAAAVAANKVMFGRATSCLAYADNMRMSNALFRGALAEALYRADRKATPTPPIAGAAEADVALRPERGTANGPFADFAMCVADARPADVEQMLFTTKLGTPDSDRAVGALSPAFGDCLPAGMTVKLQAINVRLALAEAMYHRLWAGRETAAVQTAQTR